MFFKAKRDGAKQKAGPPFGEPWWLAYAVLFDILDIKSNHRYLASFFDVVEYDLRILSSYFAEMLFDNIVEINFDNYTFFVD